MNSNSNTEIVEELQRKITYWSSRLNKINNPAEAAVLSDKIKEAREKIIAIENNQKKITITSSVAAPIVANRKKVPPSRGTMVEGGGMGTVFL